MPFRCHCATVLVLAALFFAAGCRRTDDVALVPELEDSNYKHAKQLQRHGRNGEALNAFLKVIETRGTRAAPESHLEAGVIYLHHSKNPVESIHHLNRYLELRPNAVQAPYVRDLINTATREFALRLPARPFDDQSVRLAENKEVEKLRRENEELRAELATLRGGGGVPVNRFSRTIVPPDETRPKQMPPVPSSGSSQPQPPPRSPAAIDSPISVAPASSAANDNRSVVAVPPRAAPPVATAPASPPRGTPGRPATTPTQSPAASRRTHTVMPKENLWSIARRYYGDPPAAARVNAIYEANRDVMSSPTDLKIGMTLRIP